MLVMLNKLNTSPISSKPYRSPKVNVRLTRISQESNLLPKCRPGATGATIPSIGGRHGRVTVTPGPGNGHGLKASQAAIAAFNSSLLWISRARALRGTPKKRFPAISGLPGIGELCAVLLFRRASENQSEVTYHSYREETQEEVSLVRVPSMRTITQSYNDSSTLPWLTLGCLESRNKSSNFRAYNPCCRL